MVGLKSLEVTGKRHCFFVTSCRKVENELSGRRLQEVGASIRQTFEPVIMTHLYPRSEISIHVSVLSADGGESESRFEDHDSTDR